MYGLQRYFSGISLIFTPGIRRFVWIPFTINIVLFGIASVVLWFYLSTMLDSLLPEWLDWLGWFLIPLFTVITLLLVYFTFTIMANIIASPFYVYLAKSVENHLRGDYLEPVSTATIFKESISIISLEIRKLSYYLVRAIPLLVLSIIPGINLITLPLWLMLSAWFLTFEYMGYYFENHRVGFNEQKAYLQSDKINHLMFGSASLFAASVPVFNLFSPAIGVAGATKMMIETDLA